MQYLGTYYKVTDDEILPTGKVELYIQSNRKDAIRAAIYIHEVHNKNVWASKNGVIHCPSCGQIAITKIIRDKK